MTSLVLDWLFETYWVAQEKECGKIRQQRKEKEKEQTVSEKRSEKSNKAAVHALLGGKSSPAAINAGSTTGPTATPIGTKLSLAELKERLSASSTAETAAKQQLEQSENKEQNELVFVPLVAGSAWKRLRQRQ